VGFCSPADCDGGGPIAWVVAAEVVVAMVIRDNLTLNIIMLDLADLRRSSAGKGGA
jgi:hypothetical protein